MAMSKAEAVAQLTIKYPELDPQDINDLLSPELTDDDRTLIFTFYKNSGVAPVKSFWDEFLVVLNGVESVANLVIPITGAISGLYGVAKL